MTAFCTWLHDQLEHLPLVQFPFELESLPSNGIYFFYEAGEIAGHEKNRPRIVRIGTHKDGNFRSRIGEHFLLNESKMNFHEDQSKPSDRSIFRKNIGRALLNKNKDDYLFVWNIDFTKKVHRKHLSCSRDITKEMHIEAEITEMLRQKFTFKFIIIDKQLERMGSQGLESSLIGTIAQCKSCTPSMDWIGHFSPKKKIVTSGLWQVQHLSSKGINEADKQVILSALKRTKDWNKRNV